MKRKPTFFCDPVEQFKHEIGARQPPYPVAAVAQFEQFLPTLKKCAAVFKRKAERQGELQSALSKVTPTARAYLHKRAERLKAQFVCTAEHASPEMSALRNELWMFSDDLKNLGKKGPRPNFDTFMPIITIQLRNQFGLARPEAIRVTQAIMSSVEYRPLVSSKTYDTNLYRTISRALPSE